MKKYDVVVVGAGISGLTAAASATEAGASVIQLEKGETFHHRGLHNAALASKLQKKAGIEVDRDSVIYTLMEFAAYRNNQQLVKLWADNCVGGGGYPRPHHQAMVLPQLSDHPCLSAGQTGIPSKNAIGIRRSPWTGHPLGNAGDTAGQGGKRQGHRSYCPEC